MTRTLITGAARSGTTLLARLMTAFDGVCVINEEITLPDLINTPPMVRHLVGKRAMGTIFSHRLSEQELAKQVRMVSDNDIKIVNIIRDGRDVVSSQYEKWGWYDPHGWTDVIDQAYEYEGLITYKVRYDELVTRPDRVQEWLGAVLGYEIRDKFSKYPDFVPEDCFPSDDPEYMLRKIGSRRRDRMELRKPIDKKYFEKTLGRLGYK